MSDDFLSRWSRRKHAVRAGRELPPAPVPPAEAASPVASASEEGSTNTQPTALPPVESLTPESDFTPFMQAEVDPGTRRQALKTLFADPQFNVMDGLDVYIDDYSKPDPLPEGWLAKMNQVARLGEYIAPAEHDHLDADGRSETAGSPVPSVHPQAVAAVQPESGDERLDSASPIEGMPTDKG